MAELTGCTIAVTGASSGIGRALCLELARRHTRLVLAARSEDRLRETADECRRAGAETLTVPTDVTDADACGRMVARAVEGFGALDALVNNAGIGSWARFADVTDLSVYERLMRVNYLGAVYCTWHALPHLLRSRGRIAAVASVAGLMGLPLYTAYASTKHALFGFFDSLRIELAGSGVSVTVAAPDFVDTGIFARSLGADGRPLEASPWQGQRFQPPADCARRIVRALEKRRRQVFLSARGPQALLAKALAPGLLDIITRRLTRDWK